MATPPLFSAPLALQMRKSAGLTRAFLRLKTVLRRKNRIRLQTIVNVLGRDGLLALNALLALLNIVLSPIQGISLPLGFLQVMITYALLRGQTTFWMPRRWQVYSLRAERVTTLLNKWLPTLYWLEKVSRPRIPMLMRRVWMKGLTNWLLFFLAIIVALPIPFINSTPSLAALFLCLALINADGVMWILGVIVILAHSSLYFFWQAIYPPMLAAIHHFI